MRFLISETETLELLSFTKIILFFFENYENVKTFSIFLIFRCIINKETAKQAFESCKPTKTAGAGDQFKQIEQTFCQCLRGALGKSETDMPCQPHARQEKPQA